MNHSRWINWGTVTQAQTISHKVVISVERLVPWCILHSQGSTSSLFYDCSAVCCFSSFNAERQTGDAIFQMKKIRQGSLPKATYHFMGEPESQLLPFEFPGCCLATKPPCIFYCTAAKQALNNHNWFCWLKGRAQSDSGEFVSTYQWILFFLWSITYTHFFR